MSRKKVRVNHDMCIGCGSCSATYPEDFIINDDGLAEAIDSTSNEDAIDICPVGAIEESE